MATAVRTLQRGTFVATPPSKSENMDLLTEAREVLKYSPKSLNTDQAVLDRMQGECEIEAALNKLDLHPFSSRSVDRYKNLMIRKAEKSGSNNFVLMMHDSGAGENLAWIAGLAATAISVITFIRIGTCFSWLQDHQRTADWSHLGAVTQSLPILALIAWGVFILFMYARHKTAIERQASWQRRDLPYYQKPIPDYALETAIQLKKELPAATFQVDELSVETTSVRTRYRPPAPRVFDPFLVMTYKGHDVYMEVWNEERFDGKRIR